VTLPAAQLPADVRVALDFGRPAAVVTGAGRFRVLDGAGHAIATVANGRWNVVPAPGGKLRVVAPAGQDGMPSIANLVVERAQIRLQLNAPAVVSVATGTGAVVAPTAVDAGDVVLPLAAPLPDGDGQVTLTADAGAGRAATAVTPYFIAAATPPPPPSPEAHLARAAASRSRAGFAHQSAAAGSGVLISTRPSPARQLLLGVALLALIAVVLLLAAETRARRTAALR
jgi:hypothetical protein